MPLRRLVRLTLATAGAALPVRTVTAEGARFPGMSGETLLQRYLLDIIGDPGAFAITADGGQRFAHAILNKMIREIAMVTP